MSVGRKEVEHVAALSRIPLAPDEAERLSAEMNRILEHADRLRAVSGAEGDDLAGADDPLGSESGLRHSAADRPDPLGRPLASFAPRMEASFFVVPPPPGVTAEGEQA